MIFKRKIYKKIESWKNDTNGSKALFIEGARRIGKSTIVKVFAQREYKSYIMIDFNDASEAVKDAFLNYLQDLDTFFMILSTEYKTILYPRESVLIFDEIQRFPKARQSIKRLVNDGRFDYIETGSLVSIRENVQGITIPSEERKIKMYPMDFEEFCWAMEEESMINYIKKCFEEGNPLADKLHNKAMLLYRQYLVVGGMPQSIDAYLKNGRSFQKADAEKRDILALYRDDIMKIEAKYQSRVLSIFDQIPAFLSQHEKRVVLSNIEAGTSFSKFNDTFFWLDNSMIANECFNCTDPNVGLSLNEDRTYLKCYMGDTGLLVSHAFTEAEIETEDLYRQLILGRLSVNEGMIFENAIMQTLVCNGYKPFFYTHYDTEKHRNDIEIDFLISNKSKTKYKIYPIEVKSAERYKITSLEKFCDKFRDRIGQAYVIHTKKFERKNDILYIPAYMTICL
ncbi:MAG: AAA family ATPase [Lachnoclostridium sp.]|nr:AAA family ATPase [Lachnospira sp.]MCM1247457.1 AAA family ATPase [Lachnoclostridium sp.]MCM1536205.1 AAA family ATPase [Clostridium sp.]